MATINTHYRKLGAGYLFPEIARRAKAYQSEHPEVQLHKLGIGNTTEALPPSILEGLHNKVDKLGNTDTYSGYGDEQGDTPLREALSHYYTSFGVDIKSDEFFVSDGAKADAANIQTIFGDGNVIAIQDPAYPVYVDSNVVSGRTGSFNNSTGRYDGFVYLPADSSNNFIPSIPEEKVDIMYLCSPNNPTGAVMDHQQLQSFVDYARKHKAIIIYDAAYSEFISDPSLPRTIYEIEGAKECAIEINSFSKFAGFTGVRLGWTIVPHELTCENSEVGELHNVWNRRQVTFFNGASNISQAGGRSVLTEKGLAECHSVIAYYMNNARVIREGLQQIGLEVIGGVNAPYLWVKAPQGFTSWQFFDKFLTECQVIVTPGSGFGPAGEGYVRISSFGHSENIEKAMVSIVKNLRV